jgi:hypothetical protein
MSYKSAQEKQKLAKRFKIISLVWLGLLMISVVFYFVEINIYYFFTWFLGMLPYVWFLHDDKLLQSNKHYIYCLLTTIAFGVYCLFIAPETDLVVSVLFPLSLLVVQKPTRLIYKSLFKREPIYRGNTWGDFVYTAILIATFGLPIIIWNLLK